MYQRQGAVAFKKDLSNIKLLVDHLENPQTTYKTIHVAGTNGKGSTSHMLASILQEAGYKVGLYTSPHLKDFRERMRVNGVVANKHFVINFVKKHKAFLEAHKLSFFEMTVGMAFDYFAKQEVDIAVIEVGLGGRLDATNIITPEVAVITNIGMDHTQYLGTTYSEIAFEKGGIIKEGIPVVIGEHHPETEEVFRTLSRKRNAPLHKAYTFDAIPMKSDLKGTYQQHNIRTVQVTIAQLQQKGIAVGIQHIAKGLLQVVKNTGLQGRWQIVGENPFIICDTAHNKEGLSYVLPQLETIPYHRLHVVLGVVSDKDLDDILPMFPSHATYYFCTPDVPRGMPVDTLYEKASLFGLRGEMYTSVTKALDKAKEHAKAKDLIFVGGSTFVVAEII
ncbi:folylpolyglutamate synthase/dihydrofolate synthase family protein [Dokdonia sp.]|uniref:bifunctional folylpolyglutamate synthase/dihydrofolate synthase n=1 Tax=Dokdonia sp. TaxID=2024995 RepID=UPI0032675B92